MPEFHLCFFQINVHVLIAKSTSQPLDFSSLTESCQTTDAKFSSSCGNCMKRSQKKSAKRQVFQKYSFCLIQIILGSELSYHLFLKSAVHSSMNCLWVQKLVITILCATLAYKKQVVWIHSNGNKNLHGKIYWFGQEHWFLNT